MNNNNKLMESLDDNNFQPVPLELNSNSYFEELQNDLETKDQKSINEKRELLFFFFKMQNLGIQLTRNYDLNSNLDEMRFEYELIKQREQEKTCNEYISKIKNIFYEIIRN